MGPAAAQRVCASLRAAGAWRLVCLLLPLLAAATPVTWLSGRVVGVYDGDTVTVETEAGHRLQIRFHGVDAPERATPQWPAQAYAMQATRFSRELLAGARVRVRLTGARSYGRAVGEIFVDGQSASHALVGAGLGWWNARYAPDDAQLARLERAARKARRGLWKRGVPESPWRYRARHRQR